MKKNNKRRPSLISNIITFFILCGFASIILEYLLPFLPFLIAIVIIVIGCVLFKASEDVKKRSALPAVPPPSELQNSTIRRQLEILTESTELVNTSKNLDIVLRRYNIACNTLEKLSGYSDQEISSTGYPLKEPLSKTRFYMKNNKTQIINRALERFIRNELSNLSTDNGRLKKLDSLYDKIIQKKVLENDSICFLKDLCNSIKKELNPHPLPEKHSPETSVSPPVKTGSKNYKMTGLEFERYCARLLSLNNYSSISMTKESGDQGIDIIAYKEGVKYGIQCKLYSGNVGNSAVQEVYSGKDFYKCQIGAVLTNSSFTESAKELANALGIILWDGNYLHQLEQVKSPDPVHDKPQNPPVPDPSKKYLHTKWGIYEMPDPYTIYLRKGPRKDLKKL